VEGAICKAERLFHCGGNGAQLRLIRAAAQNRRDLDLYLGAIGPDQQFGHGLFGLKDWFGNLRAENAPPHALSDSLHGGVYRREGFIPVENRQVSKIDIDRQTGHVAYDTKVRSYRYLYTILPETP
jgi:hypothetical protein